MSREVMRGDYRSVAEESLGVFKSLRAVLC